MAGRPSKLPPREPGDDHVAVFARGEGRGGQQRQREDGDTVLHWVNLKGGCSEAILAAGGFRSIPAPAVPPRFVLGERIERNRLEDRQSGKRTAMANEFMPAARNWL